MEHIYSDTNRDCTAKQFPSQNLLLRSGSTSQCTLKDWGRMEKLKRLILCVTKFMGKSEHSLPGSHSCTHIYFIPRQLSFIYFLLPSDANSLGSATLSHWHSFRSLLLRTRLWHRTSILLPTCICVANPYPALKIEFQILSHLKVSYKNSGNYFSHLWSLSTSKVIVHIWTLMIYLIGWL